MLLTSCNLSRVSIASLKRLVTLNQRQLLSPVWEHYLTGILQPKQQGWLDGFPSGMSGHFSEEKLAQVRRGVRTHPFNFSDASISENRADEFLAVLDALRINVKPKEFAGRAWWPRDTAGLIDAIMTEQDLKEEGATREEQIMAVAQKKAYYLKTHKELQWQRSNNSSAADDGSKCSNERIRLDRRVGEEGGPSRAEVLAAAFNVSI